MLLRQPENTLMSHQTAHQAAHQPGVTPTSIIDEVMGLFQRGEDALFAELAQATWGPQATLAALAGSARRDSAATRDAA